MRSVRDFTDDGDTRDTPSGHGTMMSSIAASTHPSCPGVAAHAEVHIFKIFNAQGISYTSWFIAAFDAALELGIDVVNLSNGGADFLDEPFVAKVNEAVARGVLIVGSIGNDGPDHGTLHSPADLPNVVGVGALGPKGGVAHFQSRGMTTWNLTNGVGFIKPDLVTAGERIRVLGPDGDCVETSGTSTSAAVVSSVAAVAIAAVPPEKRHLLTPGLLKSAFLQSAVRLIGAPVSEQGAGRMDEKRFLSLITAFAESNEPAEDIVRTAEEASSPLT